VELLAQVALVAAAMEKTMIQPEIREPLILAGAVGVEDLPQLAATAAPAAPVS
jgi:hypothetical protein